MNGIPGTATTTYDKGTNQRTESSHVTESCLPIGQQNIKLLSKSLERDDTIGELPNKTPTITQAPENVYEELSLNSIH